MTMRDLAEITVLATTEPRKAARALLASAPAGAIELLMDAAAWKDRDVEDFERGQLAVLIDGAGARVHRLKSGVGLGRVAVRL